MKNRSIRAAPTAHSHFRHRSGGCYFGHYVRDGYVLPGRIARRAYPKEKFILTEEPSPSELSARYKSGEGWYCFPFWNANSGDFDYNTFLEWVLFDSEAKQAVGEDEHFARSRPHLIYRVPATPIEEMFCRGQF